MSKTQTDYSSYRISLITPGSELVHPAMHDYGSSNIPNTNGEFLDLHEVPSNLQNWDYVWNSNIQVIADRLYKTSLRIAHLYSTLGIQDPEQVINPSSPWARSTTGTTTEQNTYHLTAPDGDGHVADIADGTTVATAVAELQSIIGTRSFSGSAFPAQDGWLPPNDTNASGYFISGNTTLTHNLDQLDSFLGWGSDTILTGYVTAAADGYWNAKKYKGTDGSLIWSFAANIELLNRSIGSRAVTSSTGNLSHSNELSTHVNATYADAKRTVTDSIKDLDAILGNRTIQATPGTYFTLAANWAISNVGSTNDTTTFTSLISSLNAAIGHRNIELRTGSYPLLGASGLTITEWANLLNAAIGDRVIANTTDSYALASSSGSTITAALNALNVAIGSRTLSNKTSNYVLNTDGASLFGYIDALNNQIGTRNYTISGSPLSGLSGGTITGTLQALNAAINSRIITNKSGYTLTSDGATITDYLNAVNNQIGNLSYNTGNYYPLAGVSSATTLTQLLDQLNIAIGNRVLTHVGSAYSVASSGLTISAYIQSLNESIGAKTFTNTDNCILRLSSNGTISAALEALNVGIGGRVYTTGNYYPLTSSSGTTITATLDTLNTSIGNRAYDYSLTGQVTSGETVTASIGKLKGIIGDRAYTNAASGQILNGLSSSTLTQVLSAISGQLGNFTYTSPGYIVSSEAVTASLVKLDARLKQIDTLVGNSSSGTDLSNLSATAKKFYASTYDVKNLFEQTAAWGLIDATLGDSFKLGSRDDSTGLSSINTGWFTNTGNTSLRVILQKIINRIDSIGYGW